MKQATKTRPSAQVFQLSADCWLVVFGWTEADGHFRPSHGRQSRTYKTRSGALRARDTYETQA